MNQFKHAKWWRSYLDKLWQSYWKLKFMKNQALELHSPFPKSFKVCKERARREEKQSEENRGQRLQSSCALLEHFPKSILYILYTIQSSGSQESNASNGVQFEVEVKELQPLQADHSKLKEAFCKVLHNQPFVARISQPFCTVLWISSWSYPIYSASWKLRTSRRKPTSQPYEDSMLLRSDFAAPLECLRNLADTIFSCEMVLSASRYLPPTLLDIFLQIFLYKFPFFSL